MEECKFLRVGRKRRVDERPGAGRTEQKEKGGERPPRSVLV